MAKGESAIFDIKRELREMPSRAPSSWPGVGEVMEWLRSIGVDPDRAVSLSLMASTTGPPDVMITFDMDQAPLSPEGLRRAAAKLIERAERLERECDGA